MAQWIQSYSAPVRYNKYYVNTGSGGLSPCIVVDDNGWTLPNCVAWCYGRYYEILGYDPMFSLNNADTWYGSTRDDFERASTSANPKQGDVMCWSGNGAGHVACIEEVVDNNTVIISESAYGRYEPHPNYWKRATTRRSTGFHPYGTNDGYTFQGFIRFPYTPEPPDPPEPPVGTTKLMILDAFGMELYPIK